MAHEGAGDRDFLVDHHLHQLGHDLQEEIAVKKYIHLADRASLLYLKRRPVHVLLQFSVVLLLNLVLCEWELDVLLLVLAEVEHQVVVPATNS